MPTASNGFSVGHERFEVIEGEVDQRVSVYNAYLSNGYGKTSTVWMTIEYRSNVDLCDFGTMNMVLPANTGQAKTVTVILKNVGLLGMVFSADSWLEIRTLALGTVAETESQKATYTWLSDGTKLGVDNAGNGFDYLGSLVYEKRNGQLSLESAPFGGGRIIATTSGFTPNYFLTDHLGSTRVVIDGANGDAVSRNDYYPFGMRIKNPTFAYNDNRYLYNGKEDQSVAGTDFLDYGARNYDALLGRWFNVDPLAEKYYEMSPYVYVGNNPIIYIDPDGKRLWPAPGSSKEFISKLSTTVKFMNEKGTGGILQAIHAREEVIYIAETSGDSYVNISTNTIHWNPDIAYTTSDEGVSLSPATVLNHEADHELRALEDPVGQNNDRNTPDSDYGNKEEKRVITGSEQSTALKHGEIKPGQVTRKNHSGVYKYKTTGPTSTADPNAIIITPGKKSDSPEIYQTPHDSSRYFK